MTEGFNSENYDEAILANARKYGFGDNVDAYKEAALSGKLLGKKTETEDPIADIDATPYMVSEAINASGRKIDKELFTRLMNTPLPGENVGGNIEDSVLALAKQRAVALAEAGELVEAIDSMVADMDKDPKTSAGQKQMIGMMALGLRNDPNLDREKVIKFITGFN